MNKLTYLILLSLSLIFSTCDTSNKANSTEQITDTTSEEANWFVTERVDDVLARTFQSDTFSYEIRSINDIYKKENGTDGILVDYIRSNKYNTNTSKDVGIAFLENIGGNFHLRFSNPYAMFCDDCNNVSYQDFRIDGHYIKIGISWGPSINRQYDKFEFVNIGKDWQLQALSGNDVDMDRHKIYISNYNAEYTCFDEDIYTLRYTENDIAKLSENLKWQIEERDEYGAMDPDERPNNFMRVTERDANILLKYLNIKNVQQLNDCAFFLNELNEYDPAIILLEGIISKFPDRMVAYLNLGDAYCNKHCEYYGSEIEDAYKKYLKMMEDKGLEDQVPERVIDYLDTNNEEENNN